MADQPDEHETKNKFQTWMNELLDQREDAAATAKAEADAAAAEAEAKRKTREPVSFLRDFLGFGSGA